MNRKAAAWPPQARPEAGVTLPSMRALLRLLDSRFLSRIGNLGLLVKIIGLGASVVLAVVLVGAGIVQAAGWVALACFGAWAALSALLIVTGLLRSRTPSFMSPAAHIAVRHSLPGATEQAIGALEGAWDSGRELIADVAVFEPLNNSGAAHEIAQRIGAYRQEVAQVIAAIDELDERWELLWDRIPREVPAGVAHGPLTLEMVGQVVRYLGHKMWQLKWMIEYLEGGSDRPVRHVRTSIEAYEQEARASERPRSAAW
jgi:hypothetical protein